MDTGSTLHGWCEQVDEMMASSLALHLPHAPLVSQPLAQVAMPPASAPAIFVASAVRHSLRALMLDILWQSSDCVFSLCVRHSLRAFMIKFVGCATGLWWCVES